MQGYLNQVVIQYYPRKFTAEYADKRVDGSIKAVSLVTCCEDDYKFFLKNGLAYMRQARLLRLTTQAYLQGAILSYNDLALLLTTSISTLKRDVKQIQAQRILVPLGRIFKDVGAYGDTPLLYPARALDLYFEGLALPILLEKTFMTEREFQKALVDFQIVCQAWEVDGVAGPGTRGLSPSLQKKLAFPLREHFYRVYRRHQGSALLGGLAEEILNPEKSDQNLAY